MTTADAFDDGLRGRLAFVCSHLGEAIDIDAATADEHLRINPYFRFLCAADIASVDASVRLVLADPDVAMSTSVVVSWVDRVASVGTIATYDEWMDAVRAAIEEHPFLVRRAAETRLFVRCRDNLAPTNDELERLPAWAQRRLAAESEDLPILAAIEAIGSRATRNLAARRAAVIGGRK